MLQAVHARGDLRRLEPSPGDCHLEADDRFVGFARGAPVGELAIATATPRALREIQGYAGESAMDLVREVRILVLEPRNARAQKADRFEGDVDRVESTRSGMGLSGTAASPGHASYRRSRRDSAPI